MGLFDIFKKKSNNTQQADLSLEALLEKAASEPAYRTEFYKRLLFDDLVVITQDSTLNDGNQTLQQDTQVKIVSYPDKKIPVFTSTERIFDKRIIKEQVQYLQMKGESLFEMAKGASFVLNPYSAYGKKLLPGEVEQMLNGTILTDNHRQIKIEKETSIQIGQPANYPTEIVNSLNKLFSQRPTINAAYLGWIYNPSSGEPPHYIFGLDGEGDLQDVTNEAGFTAKQFLKADDIVDFIRIDNRDGLSDYFLKSTKPFYKR